MPEYTGIVDLSISVSVTVTADSQEDAEYEMIEQAKMNFDRSDIGAEVASIEVKLS